MDMLVESSYRTPLSLSPLLPIILLSTMGQRHVPRQTYTIKDEYDYIVVGSGSAGSVVASRLAEKDCVTVLLLEAGKSPPKLTDIPVIARYLTETDLDWSFKTVRQKFTGDGLINRSLTMSAGKAFGGSSVINGMLYVRGNRKDYDNWSAGGAKGWSYDEVLPYFKKLEDNRDEEYYHNGYHSKGGPITVTKPPYSSELKYAVHKAAEDMGYEILDSNGPDQTGFYDLQATIRNGQRCSAAKAYLVPNDHRKNLDIVGEAFAKKIMIEHGQAQGVLFDHRGRTLEVRAKREVILSAGSVNSAKILMLSGIGPAEELRKHKIPVKANLPVGQNLQDHWGVLMNFELGKHIPSLYSKQKNTTNLWNYILFKNGPLTSLSGVASLAFISRNGSDAVDYPDYQLYFGEGVEEVVKHKLMIKPEYHRVIYEPYKDKPFYWCLSMILHPGSRGTVTLNSTDPYDPPLIDPNFLSHPEDMDVIVEGMKKCKEVGTSKALKEIGSKPFTTVYPGCGDFVGDDENYFRCMAKAIMMTCNHPVGTVKMGDPNDPTAVLDPQLRVKTIINLRVVDASIMPKVTSGNTNTPTMMIAEKASDIIKESIHCEKDNDMQNI